MRDRGIARKRTIAFDQLGNLKKMAEQAHPLTSEIEGWSGWNGDDAVFRIVIDPLVLRSANANHEVASCQDYASGPVTLHPLHPENARLALCARGSSYSKARSTLARRRPLRRLLHVPMAGVALADSLN